MKIIKDALIVGGGKVASAIAMLLIVKVLTGYLSVQQFGEFSLALTFCNFVTQLIMGPLGHGVGRFYIEAQKVNELGEFWSDLKALLLKSFALICIIFVIIFLMERVFGNKFGVGLLVLGLALLFGYTSGLNDIFCSMQNMALNRYISVRNNVLEIYSRLIFIPVFAIVFGGSAIVALCAYMLSGLMALTVNLINKKTIGMTGKKSQKKWDSKILELAANALFWGVFVWLVQVSDKWSINTFSSAEDVGRYAVIYQLAYVPAVMIFGVLNALVAPLIFKSGRIKLNGKYKIIISALGVLFLGNIFYKYFGSMFLEMLSGKDYLKYSDLMPVLYTAAVLYSIGDLLGMQKMATLKFGVIRRNKIFTAVMGILFNVLGAHYFGVLGVAYAVLLYSFLYLLVFMDFSIFGNDVAEVY